MKKLFILLILVFCTAQLKAYQVNPKGERPGIKFAAGTSLTYIWNQDEFGKIFYSEYTWNINAAVSFINRFWLGVQTMPTFTRNDFGGITTRNNYSMFGVFAQFDFLVIDRWKLYAETSYNYGDYCTCGYAEPYRKVGLSYLGIGGGAQLPLNFLSKNIFIDLAFFNYTILGKVDFKYNRTQYIIGINYVFGDVE